MYRYLAVIFLSLLLCSCVTQQDLQMQREMLEMKRRLGDAERSLAELQADTSGGVRAQVDTLSRNQADFQAELDGVRVDLQSIQGSAGDQMRANEDLRQELTLLRDELNLQLADYGQRLAKIEATPVAAPETKAPEKVPVASVSKVESTPAGESAPELYDRALKTIREERKFAEGRELMELFLKRYPKDDLAVNAAYWVGETYYAEKNFEKAILQFEEIIQKYGEHPKVASAMLKQALSFEATGDAETAKLLLKRVVETYPLSDEAKKAKEKLQEL